MDEVELWKLEALLEEYEDCECSINVVEQCQNHLVQLGKARSQMGFKMARARAAMRMMKPALESEPTKSPDEIKLQAEIDALRAMQPQKARASNMVMKDASTQLKASANSADIDLFAKHTEIGKDQHRELRSMTQDARQRVEQELHFHVESKKRENANQIQKLTAMLANATTIRELKDKEAAGKMKTGKGALSKVHCEQYEQLWCSDAFTQSQVLTYVQEAMQKIGPPTPERMARLVRGAEFASKYAHQQKAIPEWARYIVRKRAAFHDCVLAITEDLADVKYFGIDHMCGTPHRVHLQKLTYHEPPEEHLRRTHLAS